MGLFIVMFVIYLVVWVVQSVRIMENQCTGGIAYTYMTRGLLIYSAVLVVGIAFAPPAIPQ